MEKLQRFGGAMMPPVMLMLFAGIMIGLATIFMNQDIMGPLASDTTLWYKIWSMLYDGVYAIFNQLPLLSAIFLSLCLTNKASGKAVMESFVIFITFNHFIQSLLTSFGADVFGVDFTQEVAAPAASPWSPAPRANGASRLAPDSCCFPQCPGGLRDL